MQELVSSGKSAENLFDISLETFEHLQQEGYSLDQVFLLEKISKGIDVGSSDKVAALTQTLVRKKLLSEKGGVTRQGTELLTSLKSRASLQGAKESYKIVVESAFDRWWKTYPTTDHFEHKGKVFTGSRGLRVKKDECRTKFEKILNEGEYTVEDLIRALEYEITLKKEASLSSGENKMRYMQMTITYLNQRTFENFIEISKQAPPPSRSSADTFDI
jgi:hypothetical protein